MLKTTTMPMNQDMWYSADEIGQFVDRLVEEIELFEGVEQRRTLRRCVSVPIGIRPLGDNLEPIGDTQNAITANVSKKGIGFWHTGPIRSRFVEISMATATGAQIAAVAEIRHSNRFGNWMLSGAEFLFSPDQD
jgi:hypothetical protein